MIYFSVRAILFLIYKYMGIIGSDVNEVSVSTGSSVKDLNLPNTKEVFLGKSVPEIQQMIIKNLDKGELLTPVQTAIYLVSISDPSFGPKIEEPLDEKKEFLGTGELLKVAIESKEVDPEEWKFLSPRYDAENLEKVMESRKSLLENGKERLQGYEEPLDRRQSHIESLEQTLNKIIRGRYEKGDLEII